MGLKDYAAIVATAGGLVFGWIGSQDQLCNMDMTRSLCMASSTSHSAPAEPAAEPQAAVATEREAVAPVSGATETSTAPSQEDLLGQQYGAPPPADQGYAPMTPMSGVMPPQIADTSPAGAPGNGGQSYEQQVRDYLTASQQQNGGGFQVSGSDLMTALQPNATQSWQVQLRGGGSYRFIGACDNDCTAMDLEVYDAGGALVARDNDGDFPVVSVNPNRGGQHTVRVRMAQCNIAPCVTGVRVLER
ncbi:MAG: hypothetical protein AB7O98_09265 [Hyphomonadaceae bacterium]